MAEGISGEELLEAHVDAQYAVNRFFGIDMVRFNGAPGPNYRRPLKTGPTTWTLDGVPYWPDPRSDLVVLENPAESQSYSQRFDEEKMTGASTTGSTNTPPGRR